MIPVLYGKDEQQFRTYGLGELSEFLETPEVERERNGNYAFYMKYESDGEFADVLEEGMKIKSDAGPRTEWQTFEINRINRDSQGFIEIFANHISMRTKKDAIRPRVSGRGMNGQQLLQLWRNNLVGGEHWDVWSDIATTVSVDWSIEDFDNAREVLGGREGSILDRIGGEYEFDNQTIRLWRSMGRTAPTALEYGRNIKSVVKENQEDNIYTSVYPFATYSPEGTDSVEVVSIPEYFIDSDYIDMYDHRKVQVVDFTTEFDNENPPTPSALRTLAQNYIEANEVGSPWENITVEYQDLSKTLDYADYQIMEEVELNDIVPIEYPKFNIFNNNAKVIVTVYDPVKEEYKRIELGVIRQRLTSALNSGTNGRLSRLERELEQQHVYVMNTRGNRIWYSTPPEDREHNIGDTWFEQNGQYTRLRVWDGNQWIVQIDTEDIDVVSQQVTEALEESRDAKAQVERESEDRRADIQAESERLSSEWNERIEENEQIVEDVRHSTEALMNDFDRALSQANFTSIEDLTTTLNTRSLEAIELAQEADGHAIEALDIVNGFGTRITDVESTVDGQVTSINTAIATAERVERELTRVEETAEGARVVANRVEETAEGFERTISEVSGDVDDLSNRFVSMEANVEGIYNTVHDPDTGLLTEVSQIAEGWQVLSRDTQQSILRNGDFSGGYSSWSFGTDVYQRGISDSGILTVFLENTNGSTTGIANRFWTRPEPRFREGQSYQITFEARTDGTREVSVGQVGGEYNVRCRITSDWQTFSVTYEADRDSDFSIFIHHRGTFYFRNFHVIPVGGASSGQIAVLHNAIDLAVEEGDVVGRLNVQAGHTLIQNGEILMDADTVRFTGSAFIPNAAIEEVSANKIIGNDGEFNTLRSRFLTSNLIEADHLNVTTAMIDRLFANSALIERLTSQEAFIDDIQAIEISADKITAGTINAAEINVIGLNVSDISGLNAEFIRTQWNGIGRQITISSENGIQSIGPNGDAVRFTQGEIEFQRGSQGRHLNYNPEGLILTPFDTNTGTSMNTSLHLKTIVNAAENYIHFEDPQYSHRIRQISSILNIDHSDSGELRIRTRSGESGIIRARIFAVRDGSDNVGNRIMMIGDRIQTPRNGSRDIYISPNGQGKVRVANTARDYYPIRAIDFENASSRELKTNIEEYSGDALSVINNLRVVEYEMKRNVREGVYDRQLGLISEDSPTVASSDGESILSYKVDAYLIKGIQELSVREANTNLLASDAYLLAEQHEDEIACYKKKIEELEKKVERLEGAA